MDFTYLKFSLFAQTNELASYKKYFDSTWPFKLKIYYVFWV
jgi:hypothetical protein